jgi:hypothetical protein
LFCEQKPDGTFKKFENVTGGSIPVFRTDASIAEQLVDVMARGQRKEAEEVADTDFVNDESSEESDSEVDSDDDSEY